MSDTRPSPSYAGAEEMIALADKLEGYAERYHEQWSSACPTISWDEFDSIVSALRLSASRPGGTGEPVAVSEDELGGHVEHGLKYEISSKDGRVCARNLLLHFDITKKDASLQPLALAADLREAFSDADLNRAAQAMADADTVDGPAYKTLLLAGLAALRVEAPQSTQAEARERTLRMVAGLFEESIHESYTREQVVSIVEDMIRLGKDTNAQEAGETEA